MFQKIQLTKRKIQKNAFFMHGVKNKKIQMKKLKKMEIKIKKWWKSQK